MKLKNIYYKYLIESEQNNIPSWVWDELSRYNHSAGRLLNRQVLDYFKDYLGEKQITIYRGLGFDLSDAVTILKKFKIKEPKVGSIGTYVTGKIQSWSLSKDIAETFAGNYFMNFRDDDSLGIIFELDNVKSHDIAVPIAFLDSTILDKHIRYKQEEILLNPGSYNVKIVALLGNWSGASKLDLKKTIAKLGIDVNVEMQGMIGPTWNKEPGWNIKFPNMYQHNKWSPSIELHVSGLKVYLEVFSGINHKGVAYNTGREIRNDTEKTFSNVNDIDIYLKSDELKQNILKAYNLIKFIYYKK